MHVLTGFLGSGKTTLLRHILADPEFADTAVVINEFGEVGLDHLLVREVTDDVVLLESGCVCCSVRDDLVSTLATLHGLAKEGQIPIFARIVVETTGLADPGPIAQAVLSERRLAQSYRLGRIITAVDAVAGLETIARQRAAVQQVAMADLIVLTKTDVAEPDVVGLVSARIAALAPGIPLLRSGEADPPSAPDMFGGSLTNHAAGRDLAHCHVHGPDHTQGIWSFVIECDEPVEWPDFVDWLELLLAARGDQLLRVKGLLHIADDPRPVVIQGVQHVVYPPRLLRDWPDARRTSLVFIVAGLSRGAIERSFLTLVGKADAAI